MSLYNFCAHNLSYVKFPMKVLYFTIHIHTQINQYVVISGFPPVSFCPYRHIVKATFFHFFLSREIYTCHQKPRFIDNMPSCRAF
ncbi:hypothetical protein FCH14_22905 [Shigella flexneri]|nr:hypothetical protein [Shigella flexneri]